MLGVVLPVSRVSRRQHRVLDDQQHLVRDADGGVRGGNGEGEPANEKAAPKPAARKRSVKNSNPDRHYDLPILSAILGGKASGAENG